MMETKKQKASEYELLTRLVGALIHEIKNPLSSLTINLQLLREDWRDPKTPKEQRTLRKIDVVLGETRRLEEILNDFLRFTSSHHVQAEQCKLNRVVEEVLEFVSQECEGHGVRVRRDLDPALPAIMADPRLLKQALLNLVINAQQAMPKGGELILRTWQEGEQVCLDLTDTGEGIPAARLQKIFDVFFSTKAGGSGLGLATTRNIVERHRGTLAVQSELGKGTRFSMRLPLRPLPEGGGD